MKKRTLTMSLLLLCLAFSASGCRKKSAAAEESRIETETTEENRTGMPEEKPGKSLEAEEETEEERKSTSAFSGQRFTEPPELTLTDSLSSQLNIVSLTSGNYSWKREPDRSQSELEKDQGICIEACGIHPLEQDGEKAERIHIPDYNQMDGAPYTVSCPVMPDKITVTGWTAENLGKPESPAEETAVYEEGFLIQLKAGMVYELRAVWEEDKLSDRGFSGEAGYIFMTDGTSDTDAE